MKIIIVIILILVGVIALIGGVKSLKSTKKASQFFLLDGKLNLSSFVGTMTASNLSLGNMIFVCAIWGYFFSLSGAFWVAITIILLMVGYRIFGKHFKSYIEDSSNSGSLHEFISSLYSGKHNKALRYFSSLVTVTTLILAIILELHIAGTLFAQVFDIDVKNTFFVLLALISIYSILGGFKTVIHTDILQSILLLLAIIAGLIFYFNFDSNGGIQEYEFDKIITGTGWANSLGISFLGFGWLLINMDTWQRNSASRSLETSFKGIAISGSIMVVFVVLFALFGMYVRDAIVPIAQNLDISTSSGLFPFNDLFEISSVIDTPLLKICLSVLFSGLIMAAASTADTFFVVISHSLTTDVLISKSDESLGKLNEKENVFYGMVGRVIILISSFVIMSVWGILYYFNLLSDPLNLFYISYSVQFALLPALIWGIYRKGTLSSNAIVSIIAGILTALFVGFYNLPLVQSGFMKVKFLFRPDQWLGLLPLVTSVASLFVLLIISSINKKIKI